MHFSLEARCDKVTSCRASVDLWVPLEPLGTVVSVLIAILPPKDPDLPVGLCLHRWSGSLGGVDVIGDPCGLRDYSCSCSWPCLPWPLKDEPFPLEDWRPCPEWLGPPP